MDTVVLDGVQYVKASVVAKRFRYTSDYIGQLCRGKKIDARLVGRTWFVNPESVRDHKHRKFSKSDDPEEVLKPTSDAAEQGAKKRVSVEPVIGGKTARHTRNASASAVEERHLKVHYEPDDEALLPTIKKHVKRPPKRLRIEQVDPRRVKVSGGRGKSIRFIPGKLPDVALSGKIKVDRLEGSDTDASSTAVQSDDITRKNKAKTVTPDSQPVEQKKVKIPEVTHLATTLKGKAVEPVPVHAFKGTVLPPDSAPVRNVSSASVAHSATAVPKMSAISRSELPISAKSKTNPSFAPTLVTTKSSTPSTSFWLRTSPLFATILAIVAVLGIFAASSQVAAGDSGYHSTIVLQVATLLEMLSR